MFFLSTQLGCFKRKRLVDNAQEDENEGEQREQDDAVQPITEKKLEPESEPESGVVESNSLLDDSQTENNGFPTCEAVGEGPKEEQDVSESEAG